MKIPVFVSCPSTLNEEQDSSHNLILEELDNLELEPRTLGRSDYPTEFPLREVYILAKHCSGGVILGFHQLVVNEGIWKLDTAKEERIENPFYLPTPWNNLEAGVLFALGIPLIVFKEQGISGGVFNPGVTDVFVHKMPGIDMPEEDRRSLASLLLKWQAKVREHYYQ